MQEQATAPIAVSLAPGTITWAYADAARVIGTAFALFLRERYPDVDSVPETARSEFIELVANTIRSKYAAVPVKVATGQHQPTADTDAAQVPEPAAEYVNLGAGSFGDDARREWLNACAPGRHSRVASNPGY